MPIFPFINFPIEIDICAFFDVVVCLLNFSVGFGDDFADMRSFDDIFAVFVLFQNSDASRVFDFGVSGRKSGGM